MSHNVDLQCGCVVYVSIHPVSGEAHTRILEQRGRCCPLRRHEVGLRLPAADVALGRLHGVGVEWPGNEAPPRQDAGPRLTI